MGVLLQNNCYYKTTVIKTVITTQQLLLQFARVFDQDRCCNSRQISFHDHNTHQCKRAYAQKNICALQEYLGN